jgi:hypothetical protein
MSDDRYVPRDAIGRPMRIANPNTMKLAEGSGIQASVATHQHVRAPVLAADLNDGEKALGHRYMREDGKTFTEELQEHKNRNPHLHANQVARDVMKRRQQSEQVPGERELVVALQDPKQRRTIMQRVSAGLPAFPEK